MVNTIDAVAQQLGYDAVRRLRQGLKRAYSTVRMPCPVALTRFIGVAATIIRWKGDESGNVKKSKLAESRLDNTQKGSAKASRPQESRNGRDSCRQLFSVDPSARYPS